MKTEGGSLSTQDQRVTGGIQQPYEYRNQECTEPDWRRFPGWRDVPRTDWESARWQRAHSVKSVRELHHVFGDLVPETFYEDLLRDQEQFATMPLLLPPQIINTMAPGHPPDQDLLYADPVRRYMLPVASDREEQPSHPLAERDSLHEREMWTVEGLTHRYPTKALLEVLTTCPQYCGHCTRTDLVGPSTPQFAKLRFEGRTTSRLEAMLDYLRRTPNIRDVVVSGGDVANMSWWGLEKFIVQLLEIETIRDIRLASKSLVGMPQHWLQPEIRAGMERVARLARARNVNIAMHTHANTANSITPLVAQASRAMLEAGLRDVRNQGVLLRGVNNEPGQSLDLCFALLDNAGILPYYFYMCDMIPGSEHWRVALWEAQDLQDAIMGYLPGFATPRIVCDVPYLGKKWVHQVAEYDRELGVSQWTKNYLTNTDGPGELNQRYQYYDPISTLSPEGRERWSQNLRVQWDDEADLDLKYRNESRSAAELDRRLP